MRRRPLVLRSHGATPTRETQIEAARAVREVVADLMSEIRAGKARALDCNSTSNNGDR